jgi:predicted tellurium resistance membrane protein TerC
MGIFADPQTWIALLTLTLLEIVLGIDNIIFISILASRLPEDQEARGRQIGLVMAMVTRILLLFSINWLTSLTTPLFSIFDHEVTGRALILMAGGLFLLGKSTIEIHDKLEGLEGQSQVKAAVSFTGVIIQIMLLDIVFSLDSVITAVGMANELAVMVIAVVIAVGVMMYASRPISEFVNRHPTLKILALSFLLLIGVSLVFVNRHPTLKILALSFLLLIGVSLVAEGLEFSIPKGYIYFAMAFSFFVEVLNLRLHARELDPIRLHKTFPTVNEQEVGEGTSVPKQDTDLNK